MCEFTLFFEVDVGATAVSAFELLLLLSELVKLLPGSRERKCKQISCVTHCLRLDVAQSLIGNFPLLIVFFLDFNSLILSCDVD